ncbi:MAG: sigma-70 family RNA polymerase sigma factor [Candidatus Margulisbacteria bacterium]|nr:sigma-70 family RNA polymerase sigma factor [Candidatus Margulisiibacteriota bacterium]
MEDSIEIKEINPHTRAIELEKSKDSIPPDKMDEYLNLIRTIVASIFSGGNIPPGIEFDDLVGYGYEGLMKAWKNYKNDKGALFKTYATYRIRGEVLDYIRKEWKSRNPSYQRKVDKEKVQEKIQEIAKSVLEEINPRTEEERDGALQVALSNSAIVYLLSLENIENVANMLKKDDISNEIINRIERTNERIFLQESIEELKDEERQIVKMYYYEGKSQIEIAKVLNVSKSKVSRMHMKLLERLKHKLGGKLNKEWSV